MIKFKNEKGTFEITDDFKVKGTHKILVNILKNFVNFVSRDFHPESGDPFLILKRHLKKMGFEIIEVSTTYNPENTY